MGTRADFYVGRGPQAEWIGSIAYDGYPYDKSCLPKHWKGGVKPEVLCATTEDAYRAEVSKCLKVDSNHATTPDQGWPWPWPTSYLTDYAYAFDGGRVWMSHFNSVWQEPSYPKDEDEEVENLPMDAFPNMSERHNAPPLGDSRTGFCVLGLTK